jgi:hypothetical protein
MEFTSYQLGILAVGVLAFLCGFASGILFALGIPAGGAVALVLSLIGWGVAYRITAGRPQRR